MWQWLFWHLVLTCENGYRKCTFWERVIWSVWLHSHGVEEEVKERSECHKCHQGIQCVIISHHEPLCARQTFIFTIQAFECFPKCQTILFMFFYNVWVMCKQEGTLINILKKTLMHVCRITICSSLISALFNWNKYVRSYYHYGTSCFRRRNICHVPRNGHCSNHDQVLPQTFRLHHGR